MKTLLMNSKKIALAAAALVVLSGCALAELGSEASGADNCQRVNRSYLRPSRHCQHYTNNTFYQKFDGVVYRGVIDAKPVTLEIIGRGDKYRMSVDGLITQGELNTERGFEQDENATLFILNWKQPKANQIR
ncbi:MAG: hypothetical protein ACRC9R_10275, partial [Enterovibrio sp.]